MERPYVCGKQCGKDFRLSLHGKQCYPARHGVIAERKQDSGHPLRTPGDLSMLALVGRQVAGLQRIRQRCGLSECQAKTFACDGVDRA